MDKFIQRTEFSTPHPFRPRYRSNQTPFDVVRTAPIVSALQTMAFRLFFCDIASLRSTRPVSGSRMSSRDCLPFSVRNATVRGVVFDRSTSQFLGKMAFRNLFRHRTSPSEPMAVSRHVPAVRSSHRSFPKEANTTVRLVTAIGRKPSCFGTDAPPHCCFRVGHTGAAGCLRTRHFPRSQPLPAGGHTPAPLARSRVNNDGAVTAR